MWAQLRVWRRGARGKAEAAELLPELYGGVYDGLLRRYVPDAAPERGQIVELSCHEGQLPLLLYRERKQRILALGGPGSGKTWALELYLGLKQLGQVGLGWGGPNRTWLHVAATGDRLLDPVWKQHLELWTPLGWLDPRVRHEGELAGWLNGSRNVFRAAKAPAARIGSPIQGLSADGAGIDETQNVDDRAQRDVDERGRRAGEDYTVVETATRVDDIGSFRRRLKEYAASPDKVIVRLDPLANPFVDPAYWERLRRGMTPREWSQRMGSEDVPSERLTYHGFVFEHNVRRRPRTDDLDYRDVTAELTQRAHGRRFAFVFGHDFGVLTSATEVLKAYRYLPTGRIHWWVLAEIVSGSHTTSEGHAKKLASRWDSSTFVVRGDPGINTKDTDKSDYEQFRRAGLEIHKAAANPISVKHRVAMFNTLCCDSTGERRLFVDVDEGGKPVAPHLVDSCLGMEIDEWGNPEGAKKDYRDPSHYPAACQYGVYWEERILGIARDVGARAPGIDPLLAEAEGYR